MFYQSVVWRAHRSKNRVAAVNLSTGFLIQSVEGAYLLAWIKSHNHLIIFISTSYISKPYSNPTPQKTTAKEPLYQRHIVFERKVVRQDETEDLKLEGANVSWMWNGLSCSVSLKLPRNVPDTMANALPFEPLLVWYPVEFSRRGVDAPTFPASHELRFKMVIIRNFSER